MSTNDSTLRADVKRLNDHIVSTATIAAIREAGGSVELLLPYMLSKASLYIPVRGDMEIDYRDGDEVLTASEFIARLKSDPDFSRCFAKRADVERPLPTKNPFRRGTPDFNLTEAMRIEKADPELARRLKAAAE